MTRTTLSFAVVLAAVLWSVDARSADPVSVKVTPNRDTTIFSESGSLSNGAGSYLFAGETNEANLRRALLAFDVTSAVPAGSTIQSVSLTVYVSRTRTGDTAVALHRLQAAWGEAGSNADAREGTGAPAEAGDATWTHRFYPGTAWTKAGGDFAATRERDHRPRGPERVLHVDLGPDAQRRAGLAGRPGEQPRLDPGRQGERAEGRQAPRQPRERRSDDAPRADRLLHAGLAHGRLLRGRRHLLRGVHPGTDCDGAWQGNGVGLRPESVPAADRRLLPADRVGRLRRGRPRRSASAGRRHLPRHERASAPTRTAPSCSSRYVDPLPRPAVAAPVTGVAGGAATYYLAIREVSQQLHRDLPPTTRLGLRRRPSGASYPGPDDRGGVGRAGHRDLDRTICATTGGTLRTTHYLPVDPCLARRPTTPAPRASCPPARRPRARGSRRLSRGDVPARASRPPTYPEQRSRRRRSGTTTTRSASRG